MRDVGEAERQRRQRLARTGTPCRGSGAFPLAGKLTRPERDRAIQGRDRSQRQGKAAAEATHRHRRRLKG
ncbi:MAG: hypothetical protein CMI51_06435 [Paracoccus sp.]|nr:hypothetical protein [Paracoccus sp. (in: a-proteobacteria)]